MRPLFIARTAYGARNAFAPLASSLEDAYGFRDWVFVERDPREAAVDARLRGYKPVILYGVSSPVYLELRGEIRRVAREYPVVVGGPHAEGAYWHLLRDGAWIAVVGDGENAIQGIYEVVTGQGDPAEVPNIAYREGERFRVTRTRLVDLDEYKPHNRTHSLYPPIEVMRGCPYKCKFCQVPWLFKAAVRYRGIDAVEDAVSDYIEAGKKRVRFVAPIGFAYMSPQPGIVNYEAIRRLLETVRRRGGIPYLGSFPSEVRPEYIDAAVLSIIRELAGNKRVSVGLQSGSNRLLELVGRGHTVEEALEAVETIISARLQPVVDIIFSLPGEEEEDVVDTVSVMEHLAGRGARLRLHTFLPLPGSPLARARPKPVHPLYKKTALRLLGKGVLEGYWEDQEKLAPRIYCLTALDPAPTPEPRPLPGAVDYCHGMGGI